MARPPDARGTTTPGAVVSLLDDEYASTILVVAYDDERSAAELVDACGAAESTVYDRVDRLCEADLLVEQQAIDPDGNHYKTYRTRLDCVVVEVTGEGYDVSVEREPTDPADKLTDAFESLRG